MTIIPPRQTAGWIWITNISRERRAPASESRGQGCGRSAGRRFAP